MSNSNKETYPLKRNENINIKLPEIYKNQRILIFGNTINFFGDGNVDINLYYVNEWNRLRWIITAIQNNCEFIIVGFNEETREYYSGLFKRLNKWRLKANHKFYSINDDYDCFEKLLKELEMKFDICVMNPPYNKKEHLFFKKGLEMANINVSVMPSAWLVNQAQKKDITNYFDKFGGIIEQIEGVQWFDAKIPQMMSINYCNSVNPMQYILFDNKEYQKCNEIKKYASDKLLMEFFNIVKPNEVKDNIHIHIRRKPGTNTFKDKDILVEKPNPEQLLYRTMAIAGQTRQSSKESGEFYAIISNMKYNKACGTWEELYKIWKNKLEYYIPFNTEYELKGFWNYIHTDFIRICLYFKKNNLHIDSGELKYIPWQDFSDPIFQKPSAEIDDYLFSKYNIRKEVRDHIEEVIPDYYGIRKQKGDKQ